MLFCVFFYHSARVLAVERSGRFLSLEWWSEEEEGDSGKSVVGRLTTKVPPLGVGGGRSLCGWSCAKERQRVVVVL